MRRCPPKRGHGHNRAGFSRERSSRDADSWNGAENVGKSQYGPSRQFHAWSRHRPGTIQKNDHGGIDSPFLLLASENAGIASGQTVQRSVVNQTSESAGAGSLQFGRLNQPCELGTKRHGFMSNLVKIRRTPTGHFIGELFSWVDTGHGFHAVFFDRLIGYRLQGVSGHLAEISERAGIFGQNSLQHGFAGIR